MAQEEAVSSSDVAIRIDEDESSSCAVCMEPMEWVAVGACGHREVCLPCAVRMRFFQNDRRCCICRAFCATVVITRANSGPVNGGGGQQHQPGVNRWYHGGMAAYFDNLEPFQVATTMSSKPLCPPEPPLMADALPELSWTDLRDFLLYLAVTTVLGGAAGIPVAIYVKPWIGRLAIVLAFALGSLIYACCSWNSSPGC